MNTTKFPKVLLRQRVGEILKVMAMPTRSKNDPQRSFRNHGYPIRYPKGLEYKKGDYRRNLARFLKDADRSVLIKYFGHKEKQPQNK